MQVEWGIDQTKLDHTASGNRTNYIGDYRNAVYVSGIFHHVKLEALHAETTYFYRCCPLAVDSLDSYFDIVFTIWLQGLRRIFDVLHLLTLLH